MKNIDKIIFILGLIACIIGFGVYAGMVPAAKSGKKNATGPKGAEIEKWEDNFAAHEAVAWQAPAFDSEEGWSYDLFNSPETIWLASEHRYIAKELPIAQAEPFGVKLISLENPSSRLRISICSTAFPPKKADGGKKGGYMTVVTFESPKGEQCSVDFSKINNVKMTRQEVEGRTIITLTPKKPVEIADRNAALVNLKIVRGQSDDDEGTFYTRYMATIIDRESKNEVVRIPDEFYRNTSKTEAVFADENSETQWRVVETANADSDEPVFDLETRENPETPWTSLGTKAEFKANSATYVVKVLDIENQQATISKQSEATDRHRRPKVRQAVLDVSPN